MNENETNFDFEIKKEALYKKILSEHQHKKRTLDDIMQTMQYKLSNPEEGESVTDAMVLIPKIADVVDMMLSNDGTLVKMMEIIFKYSTMEVKKTTRTKTTTPSDEDEDDERLEKRTPITSQDDDFLSVAKMISEKYKDDE